MDGDDRKEIIFSRKYKCYQSGEGAWFSPKEAGMIVAAGFGVYATKEQEPTKTQEPESQEPSVTFPDSKTKRTKYVDRQLRSEVETRQD